MKRNKKVFVSKKYINKSKPKGLIIYVDGWCSGNPGKGGYRAILNGETLFNIRIKRTTNNIAEFLAVSSAIIYCERNKIKDYTIYTDSFTAIRWVKDGWCKTKMDLKNNIKLQERISFCEDRLRRNRNVDIRKWETKELGEIPADFNRK